MYLLEETEDAAYMRQNVIRLLESEDVNNAMLAFQIIQSGGMHDSFWQVTLSKEAQFYILSLYFDYAHFFHNHTYILTFYTLPKLIQFNYLGLLSMDFDIVENGMSFIRFKLIIPNIVELFVKTKIEKVFLKSFGITDNADIFIRELRGYNDFYPFIVINNEQNFVICLKRI